MRAQITREAQFRFISAGYQNLVIATGWRAETIAQVAKTGQTEFALATGAVDKAIENTVDAGRKESYRQVRVLMDQYGKAAEDGTRVRLDMIDAYRGRFSADSDKLHALITATMARGVTEPHSATLVGAALAVAQHQQAVAQRLLTGDGQALDAAQMVLAESESRLDAAGSELHDLAASVEAYDHSAAELLALAKKSDEIWFGAARPARLKAQDVLAGQGAVANDLSTMSAAQATRTGEAAIGDTLGAAAMALILVIAINMAFTRLVIKPVQVLTGIMLRLAQGDMTVVVPTARRDEIGEMASAVEVFKEHAEENGRLRAAQEEERVLAERERIAALNAMADQFEATVKTKVADVVVSTSAIGRTSHAMAQHSEHSGGRSMEVGDAARATKELAAIVSAATQQLTSSVDEIAQQVGHATQIARKAVDDVTDTSSHMAGLSQAVQSIGEIVKLISDIAAQTNLLALNATIEAARAGDAGKGFAVVANEVKNLANQTAKATEEITRQVGAVQTSTREMTTSIDGVANTIRSIDEVSSAIAGAVQQQDAATQEIAANIDRVARQAEVVTLSVTTLAKASTSNCAGTIRVIWSAKSLANVVEAIDGEVGTFLAKVRGTRASGM